MAIDPSVAFAGRITPPDANYPFGSAKNESAPGAGDGTPYEKLRADEVFGYQQALLTAAGIVPNGVADTAIASQYLEAMFRLQQRKNLFINGDLFFSQENDGTFSVPATATFTSAQYVVDNLIMQGTGGANALTGFKNATTRDGRRLIEVVLNGNQSDNSNIFARMFMEETVGGEEVTISFYLRNNSGAPDFNILITGNIVDAITRSIDSTEFASVDLGQSPGNGTTKRFEHTFTMSTDTLTAGKVFMLTLTLPGRNYTSDILALQDFQFERSPFATPFDVTPFAQRLFLVENRYQKSYPIGTVGGTVTSLGEVNYNAPSTNQDLINVMARQRMQAPFQVTLFSPTTGTSGQIRDVTAGSDQAATGVGIGSAGFVVRKTAAAVDGNNYTFHWLFDGRI